MDDETQVTSTEETSQRSVFDTAAADSTPVTISGAINEGRESRAAEAAVAASNELGIEGKSMIAQSNPLGMSSRQGLGAATELSKPSASLSTAHGPAPDVFKSGTGGAKLGMNIHPEHGMQSAPTVPTLMDSANTAKIRGPGNMQNTHQIKIQGISGKSMDYNGLINALHRATGGKTDFGGSLRDSRSSLTPHKLSSILEND